MTSILSLRKRLDHPTMKIGNKRWLNTDIQARIETPPIPLIKATSEKVKECNIIKIKMLQDPAPATSETYKLKFQTFENGKPEEFLQIMKELDTTTDGKGTTPATGKIKFLHTMLQGEALREFDVIASQVGSTTNGHLKLIKECLISYFACINELNKQKCTMRHAMRKPRNILFKRFSA